MTSVECVHHVKVPASIQSVCDAMIIASSQYTLEGQQIPSYLADGGGCTQCTMALYSTLIEIVLV